MESRQYDRVKSRKQVHRPSLISYERKSSIRVSTKLDYFQTCGRMMIYRLSEGVISMRDWIIIINPSVETTMKLCTVQFE